MNMSLDDDKIELDKTDEIMIIGSKKKAKITGDDYEKWVLNIDPGINPKDIYGTNK